MIVSSGAVGEGMVCFRAVDFVSEDAPAGYQTAWGWLAKNEPGVYAESTTPGGDFQEFELRAKAVAREEGIEGVELAAPLPITVTGGPASVLAFPNILYRYVFSV